MKENVILGISHFNIQNTSLLINDETYKDTEIYDPFIRKILIKTIPACVTAEEL